MKKFSFINYSEDVDMGDLLRVNLLYDQVTGEWTAISMNSDSFMKQVVDLGGWRDAIFYLKGEVTDSYFRSSALFHRIVNINELPDVQKKQIIDDEHNAALWLNKDVDMEIQKRKIRKEFKKEVFLNMKGVRRYRDFMDCSYGTQEIQLRRIRDKDGGGIIFQKKTYKRRQDGTFNWGLIRKNVEKREEYTAYEEAKRRDVMWRREQRVKQLTDLGVSTGYSLSGQINNEPCYLSSHLTVEELQKVVEKLIENGYSKDNAIRLTVPIENDGKDIKMVVGAFREVGKFYN